MEPYPLQHYCHKKHYFHLDAPVPLAQHGDVSIIADKPHALQHKGCLKDNFCIKLIAQQYLAHGLACQSTAFRAAQAKKYRARRGMGS